MLRIPLFLALMVSIAFIVDFVRADPARGQKGRKSMPRIVVTQKNVELKLHDQVKVRREDPPLLFDDQAKERKPTAEEMRTLKGNDSRLPGYAAEPSDLRKGQVVKVKLNKTLKGPDADKSTGAKAGEAVGVIQNVDSKARKLTLQIDVPTLQRGGAGRPNNQAKDDKAQGTELPNVVATTILILDSSKAQSGAKKKEK